MNAPSKIDVHINLLPPSFIGADSSLFSGETASFQRSFKIGAAHRLHAQCAEESVLEYIVKNDVFKAICFPYQFQNHAFCQMANAHVGEVVQRHIGALRGMVVLQPRDPRAPSELEGWLDKTGIIGLKVKPKWGGFSLSDLSVMGALCEVLIEKNGVLLTHVSQNFHSSEGDSVSDLVELLRSFPRLKIIAAHLGGFIDVYSQHEPIGKLLRNLAIDISLPNNLQWLPSLVRLGGSCGYLYGSDFPYVRIEEMNERIQKSGLKSSEVASIFRENADRFLAGVRNW